MVEGNPLIELLLCVVMLATACGAGRICLWLIGVRRFAGRLDHTVLSIALGTILFGFIALAIGLSGLLFPSAARGSLLLFALFGFAGLTVPRFKAGVMYDERRSRRKVSVFSVCIGAFFLAFAVFNLISALTPTLNNDTLNLYFWCPKVWIQQNAIIDVELKFVDNIIFWVSILHAYCMLLSSEVLAKLFDVYAPGVLSAFVVFLLARRYIKLEVAILAAAIYYNSYCNIWMSESGRINFAMAFYELSAMYCFFVWLDAGAVEKKKWVLLSGLFAGFAAGIHISSFKTVIVIAFLIVLASLWKRRCSVSGTAKLLLIFLASALLLASPLFIRNYVTTGNPTYPLLHWVFGGEEYAGIYGPNIMSRGQDTPIARDFFCKLWDITTKPLAKTRSTNPCPLILVFVPLFLLVKNAPRRIWHFFGVALIIYTLWFFTQRMARYGYDYLSLLSIVASYTICAFLQSRKRILIAVTVGAVLMAFVLDMERNIRFYYPDTAMLRCAVGILPRREYLIRISADRPFSPNYSMCEYINNNTPDTAIVFGTSEVEEYWFDRPYLSVREQAGSDIYYEKSPEEILRRMKEQGITHVIYSARYIDAINWWMRASDIVDGEFYPRDNLFEDPEFQKKHLKKVMEDHTDVLYEVRYLSDEDI